MVADYDEARADERSTRGVDVGRTTGSWPPRSTRRTRGSVEALVREARDHPRDERGRPASSSCRSSTARSPPVPTTSTWRCPCRSRTTRTPYAQVGVKLGDEQFASRRRCGSARAGSPWSGSASSPGSPTSSPATPPTTCSPRSTSSAPATARTSWSPRRRQRVFAPSFSIWTTIEECLNPPVIWEKDARLVHHAAVQRAGGLRLPRGHRPGRVRQRRARGGAADAALGRLPSARRSSTASATSSSTCSRSCTSSASTAPRR